MEKTTSPMPCRDLRGRPQKYKLQDLAPCSDDCYKFPIDNENVYFLRGSLFSSASHYGIKIKTEYADGILTVWRLK
jgi:hypothetical protein